jgi:hypothetical protein
MSFNVFKARYSLAIPDPDMPSPRYHTVIFVATNSDGSGFIHHVTGDLVTGMRYERKIGKMPEESGTFHNKELLGKIQAADYPTRVDQVCIAQPPPPPQKRFNPKTSKTEQFKPDGTFYAPNEPREKMKKCTEWTEEQAIPALYASGVLLRNE